MIPYVCNLKKSRRDRRDFIYTGSPERPILPSLVDHRSKLRQVRDQGHQGSCYAQAAACMKEWQEDEEDE